MKKRKRKRYEPTKERKRMIKIFGRKLRTYEKTEKEKREILERKYITGE